MTKEQKFLLLVVLIIAGASVSYYYVTTTPKTPTLSTGTGSPTPTGTTTVPVVIPHSFTADATYVVPEGGSETIHITVSLSGDTINDIVFSYDTPKKRESRANIGNFEAAFTSLSFKGKKLTDVSLTRVGGASLTTNAFMEALGKVRSQALNG